MSKNISESAIFTLEVFEYLADNPAMSHSLMDLTQQFTHSKTSVFRALKSLAQAGWVEQVNKQWCVSKKLLVLAHNHRRQVQEKVKAIQDDYRLLTGEDL